MSPARDEAIRVFLAASNRPTLDRWVSWFSRSNDIAIVGSATDGQRALTEIPRGQPWVVLVDLEVQPSGIEITRSIDQRFPGVRVIVLAEERGLGFFKEALHAGARDFLVQPVEPAEVVKSIQSVSEGMANPWGAEREVSGQGFGRMIAVVGGKGGVGKTLVSVNLAALFAQRFGDKVTLVDLSAQTGDVDLFLNLKSQRTLSDLVAVMRQLSPKAVDAVLTPAVHGLRVLLAPAQPEGADMLDLDSVTALLTYFKDTYPLTLVDTSSHIDDVLLVTLREADAVLLVATPELTALRDGARLLHVMERLKYPLDKVQIVLNRVRPESAVGAQQITQYLGRTVFATLPDSVEMAEAMINEGKSCLQWPKTPLTTALTVLAEKLLPLVASSILQGEGDAGAAPSRARSRA